MPVLKLMRPDEKVNQLAEMVVYLNGKPLGCLYNNESKEFNIPAEQHTIKAKIDSQPGKVHIFNISPSQTKAFVIATDNDANKLEPVMSGTFLDFIVVPLQILLYFIIGHNRYITVSELKQK